MRTTQNTVHILKKGHNKQQKNYMI